MHFDDAPTNGPFGPRRESFMHPSSNQNLEPIRTAVIDRALTAVARVLQGRAGTLVLIAQRWTEFEGAQP